MDKPDNCGPTYIILGDGGNEEGVENDFTQPQAGWSAYRDLAFGQAEFTILNDTAANWTWKADDGLPLDQVCCSDCKQGVSGWTLLISMHVAAACQTCKANDGSLFANDGPP